MKIVYLAKWKPGADQADIAALLREAPGIFARGPFVSCEHGEGLGLATRADASADWGFIIDIAPSDFGTWRDSQAHEDLGRVLRPIVGEGMTIEF